MPSVTYQGYPTKVDPKDPDAVLDYEFDWSDWLENDTISDSEWIVPSGIDKDSDTNDDTTTTIWLSGGVAGESYEVTNRITTAAGRTQDRSMVVPVREM